MVGSKLERLKQMASLLVEMLVLLRLKGSHLVGSLAPMTRMEKEMDEKTEPLRSTAVTMEFQFQWAVPIPRGVEWAPC